MDNLEYKEILDELLSSKKIENIEIDNMEIIKNIFDDESIYTTIKNGFDDNFETIDDESGYTKVQDMLYRINLLLNEVLIDCINIYDSTELNNNLLFFLTESDIDLYSAVNYNEDDKEEIDNMKEEILSFFIGKNI